MSETQIERRDAIVQAIRELAADTGGRVFVHQWDCTEDMDSQEALGERCPCGPDWFDVEPGETVQ